MKFIVLFILTCSNGASADCASSVEFFLKAKKEKLSGDKAEFHRLAAQIKSVAENILSGKVEQKEYLIFSIKKEELYYTEYSSDKSKNKVSIVFSKFGIVEGYKLETGNKPYYQCLNNKEIPINSGKSKS